MGPAGIGCSWAPLPPLAPGRAFRTQARAACPLLSSPLPSDGARGPPPRPAWEAAPEGPGAGGRSIPAEGMGTPARGAGIPAGAGSAAPAHPGGEPHPAPGAASLPRI